MLFKFRVSHVDFFPWKKEFIKGKKQRNFFGKKISFQSFLLENPEWEKRKGIYFNYFFPQFHLPSIDFELWLLCRLLTLQQKFSLWILIFRFVLFLKNFFVQKFTQINFKFHIHSKRFLINFFFRKIFCDFFLH